MRRGQHSGTPRRRGYPAVAGQGVRAWQAEPMLDGSARIPHHATRPGRRRSVDSGPAIWSGRSSRPGSIAGHMRDASPSGTGRHFGWERSTSTRTVSPLFIGPTGTRTRLVKHVFCLQQGAAIPPSPKGDGPLAGFLWRHGHPGAGGPGGRRCARDQADGDRLRPGPARPGGPGRPPPRGLDPAEGPRPGGRPARPARHGRILVRPQRPPDGQPALSAPGVGAGAGLARGVVRSRGDAEERVCHPRRRLAGAGRHSPDGVRPEAGAGLGRGPRRSLGLGTAARPLGGLGLGVLGAGRAERGALLAGDPVPDPAAVHVAGGRAGGGSPGPAVRSPPVGRLDGGRAAGGSPAGPAGMAVRPRHDRPGTSRRRSPAGSPR